MSTCGRGIKAKLGLKINGCDAAGLVIVFTSQVCAAVYIPIAQQRASPNHKWILTMRVNIYAEELREPTDKHGERVVLRKKRVVPGFNHFGIQILLGDRVIHAEHGKQKDDDTPAVTFWFASEYEKTMLVEILESALEKVRETQISELAP